MRWIPLFLLTTVAIAYTQFAPDVRAPQAVANTQSGSTVQGSFEFEVIESYDAKYLGDTPGHIGRHGELGNRRPQAALGDPVFRGEAKVGTVTGLKWSQAHGSLEIEFDPQPFERICVGDVVLIRFGEPKRDSQ